MDKKTGACGSVLNLLGDYTFNHKVEIETGIMQEKCEKILKDFFENFVKIGLTSFGLYDILVYGNYRNFRKY